MALSDFKHKNGRISTYRGLTMESYFPKEMSERAYLDAMKDRKEFLLGLTEKEYKELEKEIEDEDKRRIYSDNNNYYEWKERLVKNKEYIRPERNPDEDTLGSFVTRENGAKCLALSIITNSITEFLRYHPDNPTMKEDAKQAEKSKYKKNLYEYDVHVHEQAKYWLFHDSDDDFTSYYPNTLRAYIKDSGLPLERIRNNILLRLDALNASNWFGYMKRGVYTDKSRKVRGKHANTLQEQECLVV
jgi:hypothetical protein